jgi:hypothetical protein
MSRVEFEHIIPAFEQVKAVHALDRAATVIDKKFNDLIGNRNRDFPFCSTVPQLTTLPRAPKL